MRIVLFPQTDGYRKMPKENVVRSKLAHRSAEQPLGCGQGLRIVLVDRHVTELELPGRMRAA